MFLFHFGYHTSFVLLLVSIAGSQVIIEVFMLFGSRGQNFLNTLYRVHTLNLGLKHPIFKIRILPRYLIYNTLYKLNFLLQAILDDNETAINPSQSTESTDKIVSAEQELMMLMSRESAI
jgi:hypothetical protein